MTSRESIKKEMKRKGRVLKHLGTHTKALLSREIEDEDYEVKISIKALDSEDIVAFANSEGGIILIGVDDKTMKVVGFGGSSSSAMDRNKGSLIKKGLGCHPPIPVIIDIENTTTNKPLYKIHVPDMPCLCRTSGGVYKRRDNGQNAGILIDEIVARVLEMEAREFAGRLEEAAGYIESRIIDMDGKVTDLDTTVSTYETSLNEIAGEIINGTREETEGLIDYYTSDAVHKTEESWSDLSDDHFSIRRDTRILEKLVNALLIATGNNGLSREDILEKAEDEVLERHSLASPEGGGFQLRSILEYQAKSLKEDTGRDEAANDFIKKCIEGTFEIGKCPHCRKRNIIFMAEDPKLSLRRAGREKLDRGLGGTAPRLEIERSSEYAEKTEKKPRGGIQGQGGPGGDQGRANPCPTCRAVRCAS